MTESKDGSELCKTASRRYCSELVPRWMQCGRSGVSWKEKGIVEGRAVEEEFGCAVEVVAAEAECHSVCDDENSVMESVGPVSIAWSDMVLQQEGGQ